MSELSTKPYLIRAIYEWCTDSGYTPYIAAAVDARTRVPKEYVKNGEIVLNISFTATSGLKMENDFISFNARFGGVSRDISIPVDNIVAIYARENGQGMAFEVERNSNRGQDSSEPAPPSLAAVPAQQESPVPDDNNEPPKKGGKPTLTRIK